MLTLDLIDFARAAHRFQGNIYVYKLTVKISQRTQMEDMHRTRHTGWAPSFCAFSGCTTLQELPHVQESGGSPDLFLLFFMWASLSRHARLNYRPLVTNLTFSHSPLPEGQGIGLKVLTF